MADALIVQPQKAELVLQVGQVPVSTGGGGAPSGPAGGDLSGTYPNPSVGALPESRITNLTSDLATLTAAIAAIAAAIANAPKYVRLTSDFNESAHTLTDTALAFTPAANSTYLIELFLAFTSVISTTGLQYTLSGPVSGATLQTQYLRSGTGNATEIFRFQGFDSVLPGGASQGATATIAMGVAIVVTGASPSGPIKLQAMSEIAASLATVLTGSVMRYTLIP